MLFTSILLPGLLASSVHALPQTTTPSSSIAPQAYPQKCTSPELRKEWRQLNAKERKAYTDAVLCLKTKPSRIGLIHFVASFLPWHRYFLSLYETALRQQCSYEGLVPYWDWTLDSPHNVSQSPIWSSKTGLGGNGNPLKPVTLSDGFTRNCITDGPFHNLKVSYFGPGLEEHCLTRNFNDGTEQIGDMLASAYKPDVVNEIQNSKDYDSYRRTLESGPHGAIHSAVGGDLGPATSPNDPIFFLHHAQIDRLWWLWQQKDPKKRNIEFGGNKMQEDGGAEGSSPRAELSDVLSVRGLGGDVKVSDFMTTQNERLCYRY
ncbi:hypothetical protein CB0940_10441 [Cercospora beticola]|uniref:Tyrosinase copper-binding domain-containing protein n=1 Tax=Cercospora beticola TaxID=122368 RepID=A0A2G5HUW4_CERBT|nr:hypothetical protein CB0940_10441 [Cercospora beticola]PIA96337.1 hypothetical protein CB0940_10441 [Cercospora beticola]WPB07159.1 hypothetical protein RHO25_011819 [Cercospora beticola]CAK1367117.1 unnamed protein product [Cercospora beticola]